MLLLVVVSVDVLSNTPDVAALPNAEAPKLAPLGWASALAAVGGAVFLFTGFEWVTPLGRRPSSYRARVPWSMPLSLFILTGLFILLAAALGHSLVPAVIGASAAPQVLLGMSASLKWARYAMALVSAFSTLTTFNAGLMGTSRLLYALAREDRFPSWAATLWDRTGVPVLAVLFLSTSCLFSACLQWWTHAEGSVAVVCAMLYALVYGAFVLAARRLRRTRPGVARPFRSRIPEVIELGAAAAIVLVGMLLVATAEHLASTLFLAAASLGIAVVSAWLLRGKASEPSAVGPGLSKATISGGQR